MIGLDVRNILSQNINRFREIRRFSQAELAFDADISIPFLSDTERENKWSPPDTLAQIAAVTEILNAQKKVAEGIVQKYARIEIASAKSTI